MARGGGKVIIVKRTKKVGHAHHGGSWKVAYADFVTAMMAFFMVMWILGMDEQTKKAIEGYFASPVGYKKGYASGKSPLSSGSSPAAVPREAMMLASHNSQQQRFEAVRAELLGALDSLAALGKLRAKVEITVSRAGLRIELVEDEKGDTFFPIASAVMTELGHATLQVIAQELRTLENPVVIEGHTDAAQYARGAYSNWELSADRANAARRILERYELAPQRIVEVNGLADKQLKYPAEPLNPSNRRISILLPFVTPPDTPSVEALRERLGGGARRQS